MGLSETSIKDCQRRDRLLFISALAVMILTLLGAAGETLGMDRQMKVNTVKHRTHSLFRQGCYYYGRLPTLKLDDFKKLMECFTDLLAEQQMLTDVLGFI